MHTGCRSIANNIGKILEGYYRGFPVIKELIQNSNDANATELIIGYTEQTQGFLNPLIKKVPTLFIVNNGPFSYKDVDAITQPHISGKDDLITTGKFGIGLNSVFHYCEGFFYLTNKLHGSQSDLKSVPEENYDRYSKTFYLVTPWSEYTKNNPYKEWKRNCDNNWIKDKETAKELLKEHIAGKDDWFALLIPLRLKNIINGRDYILADVFDKQLPQIQEDLFNNKVYQMVCNILPMLHKLNKVSFFIDGIEQVAIKHSEVKFPSFYDIDQNYQMNRIIKNGLSGTVSSKSGQLNNYTFYSLINDLTFDDEVRVIYDEAKNKKHKVMPPNAAILITQNNHTKQNTTVEFDYSNTLPLTKSENLVHAKYHIFMHGSFFVDSKRQNFELDGIGEDQQERNKHIKWNKAIYKKALTLFLSCLHDFYTRHEVSIADMDKISKVIIGEVKRKAEKPIPEYLAHICNENMWAAVVLDNKAEWKLIPKDEEYYSLDKDFINHVENMPAMAEICNNYNIVLNRHNNIVLPDKRKPWLPEHWNAFLDIDANQLIADSEYLEYWIKELTTQSKLCINDYEIAKIINQGLKNLVLSLNFEDIKQHGNEIKKLLNHVRDKIIILNKLDETTWRNINKVTDSYIALPDSIKEHISNENNPVKLPYNTALNALKYLANNNESLQENCEILAVGILSQTQNTKRDDEYLRLPFIKVEDLSGNYSFFTLEKMKSEYVIMSPKTIEPEKLHKAFGNLPLYIGSLNSEYVDRDYRANALNLKYIEDNYSKWNYGKLSDRVELIKHLNNKLGFDKLKNHVSLISSILTGQRSYSDQETYLYGEENTFYKVAKHLWDTQERGYDKIILGDVGLGKNDAESMGITLVDNDIPECLFDYISDTTDLSWLTLEERENLYKTIDIKTKTKIPLLKLPIFKTTKGELISIYEDRDTVQLMSQHLSQKELPETKRIILEYNEFLDNHTNIPKTTNRTLIKIYLEDEEPAKYQKQIINSLLKLESNTINAIYELGEKPWMVINGKATCPKDILYHPSITEQIQKILDKFYEEDPQGKFYATRVSLPLEYKTKDIEDKLKNMAAWDVEAVCEKVGQVISQTAGLNLYVIGEDVNPLEEFSFWEPALKTLDIYEIIDKCSKSISKEHLEKYFYPNVFQQNPPIKIRIMILNQAGKYLNGLPLRVNEYEKYYYKYLDIFRNYLEPTYAKEILENIKLPNIKKKWLPADKLCLEQGIIPEDIILDEKIRDILCDEQHKNIISQPNVKYLGEQVDFQKHELLEYLQRIANHIDKTLVGVFLSFLADGDPDWRKWASEKFLSGHQTVDSIRKKVKSEWKKVIAPAHRGEAFIKARHKDVDENFWTYVIRLRFRSIPERIVVKSILGNDIETHSNDSFLDFIKKNEAENTYDFVFYKVDLDSLNLSEYDLVSSSIESMLFQALNLIVSNCYGISYLQSQVKRLVWEEYKTDSQDSIFYAQRQIKKNIDGIFKRLKIANKSKKAQELMDRYGSIDRDIAIIEDRQNTLKMSMAGDEEQQERYNELSEDHKNLSEKQKEVIKEIECSLSDEDIHMALLTGMREELVSHQYDYSSILFELFQNADDACIELDEMDRKQEKYYFQVKTNDELTDIYVIHNGRFINEHEGNIKSSRKSRGYHNDLENMLNLNYSDKHSEEVTGKFGLGFKSIYLATGNPQVVSGRLHFKVKGGIYPIPLTDEELNSLKNLIDDGKGKNEGTIIAIKSIQDETYNKVLDEFQNNLQMLPLFSKKIQNIYINQSCTRSYTEEIQKSIFKYQTSQGDFLCFSSSDLWQIVFAFRDGFIEMPEDLCRIWVTVPVLGSRHNFPCAINARFVLDHGRKQIASNDNNQELLKMMGKEFHDILLSLLDDKANGYENIDFYTDQDIDYYLFWSSLFEILTGKNRTLSPNDYQIESVFWGKAQKNYRSLIENYKVVPSLIDSMPTHLIRLKDVKYKLSKEFNEEQSLRILKKLGVDLDSLISTKTFSRIQILCDSSHATIEELNCLKLVQLIFSDGKFEIEKANTFGTLLKLKQDSIALETKKDISASLKFKAYDGFWQNSASLIPVHSECSELKEFVPHYHLLHDEYSDTIVRFFFDEPRNNIIIKSMQTITNDDTVIEHALSYTLNNFEDSLKDYKDQILALWWLNDIDRLRNISRGWKDEKKLTQLEELIRLIISKDLNTDTNKYSYKWFKNLLFALNYPEENRKETKRTESVKFRKHKISDDRRIIQLSDPNRYLLQSYETAKHISLIFPSGKEYSFENGIKGVSVTEAYVEVMFENRLSNEEIDQIVPSTVFPFKFAEFRDVKGVWEIAYNNLGYHDYDCLKGKLSKNIEFIFGPPGTGKTYELAKRLTSIATEHSNILALTPTNVAADQILLKLDEQKSMALHNTTRFGNCTNAYIHEGGWVAHSGSHRSYDNKTTITTAIRFPYDGYLGSKFVTQKWDYIIFDEASMLPIHYITYIIIKASEINPECKFIVAGDPLQIPPIYNFPKDKSSDKFSGEIEKQLESIQDDVAEETIYTMVGLSEFKEKSEDYDLRYKVTPLTTQRRSIEPIGELFSHFSYNGIIKHKAGTENISMPKSEFFKPKPITIIKCPVIGGGVYRVRKIDGSSTHPYSAILVVEYIKSIVNKLGKDTSIGVICPYRSQADLVKKLLDEQNFESLDYHADTIHGFQGGQKDIVFCLFNTPVRYEESGGNASFVGSPNAKNPIMLNKKYIINVGVSRARKHLFLLIPDEYYRDQDKKVGGYHNLIHLNRLLEVVQHKNIKNHVCMTTSDIMEKHLFNRQDYILRNSINISHDNVNVYHKPYKRYLISHDDDNIDIQIDYEESEKQPKSSGGYNE